MMDGSVDRQAALQAFRANFPGLNGQVYFDVAARGLVSTPVRAAIDRFLDSRMVGGDKPAMFEAVERARANFARLIGADADDVALTKNISDGINAVAASLDWRAGDNVVLATELEHPANILPWHNLARRAGVTLKGVAADSGDMPIEAMLAAIDDRTRAVAVSSVTFSPGFRTDLAALAGACRAKDAILVVDAAQSAGVLATDVKALGVDVLAASTQKGLLGLYGLGLLYVRPALAATLAPAYLSRMGVALDSEHEAASGGFEDFRYAKGARRFDVGNFNYLGAVAAGQAMDDLLSLGPETVEAHILGLARRLRDGMEQQGLPVFRPPTPEAESHIVAIGHGLGDVHDGTDDGDMAALSAHLSDNGVAHSIRRGVLRLSLHAYNDAADVERTIDLAANI